MSKMYALMAENETAAKETAICKDCFKDEANQAYIREQASQSDDTDANAAFVDCSDEDLVCCVCGDLNKFEVQVTEKRMVRCTYVVEAVDADKAYDKAEMGDTIEESEDESSMEVLDRTVSGDIKRID
jgi:hypothetical protein